MSNYLAHAIGIQATHYLPLNSDVRSPRASYNKSDDKIHVHWTIDQTPVDTTMEGYSRNKFGDVVYNSMSVSFCKDMIKRYGTGYLNSYKDSRAVWDDGRLTQMARNMHNQLQSALAQVSNQTNGVRHSAMDIIDVSDDVLQHRAQHEGYYSPNLNYAGKASPYVFDTLTKSSDGRQVGVRFKGATDRDWVIIYVPSDFTPTYNNFIKLINDYKDSSNKKLVIKESEKEKAARVLTNFFNPPSVSGNEKMATSIKRPQYLKHSGYYSPNLRVVRHSAFTEVYDMDDYLEHHGILGMKWGVRRYQNADGSLTKEGREHYKIEGARFKERYKDNYEQALKTANDARKAAIEKAKEGKDGASYLNKAFHQQNLADRYAKKLDKKSQGLMSFEKNKEAEKLGKEIYEYYKDKPTGKFIAQSLGLSAVTTAASFGLSAALGLPLFFLYSVEANRYELKEDDKVKHSSIDDNLEDYLEHHGVKGMKWGVVNEDEKLPGSSVAKRLADAKRRNSQHSGYYNPNVGSQSSRVSQGGDKTGSSVSSNNRRVSSKVNKTRQSSYDSVVMSPGPKDKQYQNKFRWPGTASGGDDGIQYSLREKDTGKTHVFKYLASEIKKYDNAEEAAYGIPETIIRQAKDFGIFLTEGMFKSIVYDMKRGLDLFSDRYFD